MENFDSVSRYAKIAEESAGTAQQKMLAYTDSIEAAKNRTTTALEQLALDLNLTDRIKDFYDVITYLTENLGKLSLMIVGMLVATNGKDVARGLGNGVISLSNTALSGTNLIGSLFGGGGFVETVKNGWGNFRDLVYNEELAKISSRYGDKVQKIFPRLGSEDIEVLKGFKDKSRGLTDETIKTIKERDLFKKTSLELEALFGASGDLKDMDATLKKLVLSLSKTALSIDTLNDDGIEKLLDLGRNEEDEIGGINSDESITQRLGAIGGMGIGAFGGFELGEYIHEGFGVYGTIIGSQIGAYAGGEFLKSVTAALSAVKGGAGLGGAISAFTSVLTNPFLAIPAIIGTAAAGIWALNEKKKKEFLSDLEEDYKNLQGEYNLALEGSVQVTEYDKLVEGVDSLGRNVSLTNEDYLKFLEISENLAETFPDLETRVDSAGNTFILNGGKVGKMTEAVDELTESLKELRDLALLNSKTTTMGSEVSLLQNDLNKLKEAERELDNQKSNEYELKKKYLLDNGVKTFMSQEQDENGNMVSSYSIDTEGTLNYYRKEIETYNNLLLEAQSELKSTTNETVKENLERDVEEYTKQISKLQLNLTDLENSNIEKEAELYAKKQNKTSRKEAQDNYDAIKESLVPYTDAIINTSPLLKARYEGMDEEVQAIVLSLNKNINLENVETDEDFKKIIQDNVNKVLEIIDSNPDFVKLIKMFYEITPETKIGDFAKNREDFKNWILALSDEIIPDELKKTILLSLEFEYDESKEKWFDKLNPLLSIENEGLLARLEDPTVGKHMLEAYNIELVTVAYRVLDNLMEGMTITSDELNQKVAMNGVTNKKASELISIYNKIKDNTDKISTIQKDYIEGLLDIWADSVGVVKGKYEEIIGVLNQFGDLTPAGTSELNLDEIQSKYEGYKSLLDYLNNDYKEGEAWDSKQFSFVVNDSELVKVYDDVDTLKETVTEFVGGGVDGLVLNSILGSLIATEEGTNIIKKYAQEEIEAFDLAHGTMLKDVSTFKQAEESINAATTAAINGDYLSLFISLSTLYGTDTSLFVTEQLKKLKALEMVNRFMGSSKEDIKYAGMTAYYKAQKEATEKGLDNNLRKELENKYKEQELQNMADKNIEKEFLEGMDELESIINQVPKVNLDFTSTKPKDDKSKSGSGSDNLPDEKYRPSDYLETMESLINKEWEAMEAFDELTGKPKVIDVLVDDYGVKEFFNTYKKQVSEAKDKATIDKAYKDLQEAAGKAGISVEQLNEAIANNNIESVLGSKEVELQTKYFDMMRESIQKRLEQLRKDIEQSEKDYETLKAKADSYGDQQTKEAIEARNETGDAYKELVGYQKQEIELQVQLNNLDDELVQDEISLAEAKNASLKTLIKLNQQLLWTADTEEERVQHNKTILDLMKQQYEEAKRVREFYQNYAERTKNVYSGTAWSNSTDYDTMQKYQFAYNEKNALAILAERDRRYSIRYDELMAEGIYTEAEAKKLAMEDEEVLSLTEEFMDTIDKRAEIIYQGIEDKTNELDKKLDLIERGRPKEWTNVSLIQASFNSETAVLIEKLNVLNQGLALAAYLTDELILNMVDEINDSRLKLQEGNIALAEAIKGLQEKQFDAVKSKVEDYKNDLLDLIDAIEQAYEDELKPLQENNEERKRAIELEEKLNAIKNKEKEKQRVFRAGIGWVK